MPARRRAVEILPAQAVAGTLVEIQYCCPQPWTATCVSLWIRYPMSLKGLGTGQAVSLSRTLELTCLMSRLAFKFTFLDSSYVVTEYR